MIYAKPSTSLLVVFRAYLASDHVTPATGKTIAITISKNGGAFGNPNAGATNATEISSGFYKVTLDATDTGTAGPLAVRGAVATVDDVGAIFYVGQAPADVTHFGGSAGTFSGGRPDVNTTHVAGTSQTGRDLGATLGVAGAGLTAIPDLAGVTTLLSRLSSARAGYLDNLSAGAVALASALSTAQTDLTTLVGRLTSARAGYLDNLSAGAVALASALSTAQTDLTTLVGRLTALRAGYLDNLSGGAVALAADLATVAGYIDTEVAAILAAVDTEVAAIKAVTDLLPNGGALSSLATAAALTAAAADVTTLIARITSARAGYLDNLSAGAVALEATLTAIKGGSWSSETLVAIAARLPAALTAGGYMKADALAINGATAAAVRLALSAGVIIPGTVDSTAFTPTTTVFDADDITTAAADHYIGRVIVFTSGTLVGQATTITDYALTSGRGRFTVDTLTSAPANDVTFVIV